MAEINVERKKSVWPWIIALIVLLLLIWGAFELMDNGPATADVPATTDTAEPRADTAAEDATPPPQ